MVLLLFIINRKKQEVFLLIMGVREIKSWTKVGFCWGGGFVLFVVFFCFVFFLGGGVETDSETETQTESQRDKGKDKEIETHRDKHADRSTERQNDMETDINKQADRK